jgi:hypothetical protein
MNALIIGITGGLLVILTIHLLKFLDKQVIYGLILCGIGYLYVGYTWRDLTSLVITSTQSLLFLFIAYYGIKKSMIVLAAGYFLHGIWDLVFDLFPYSSSIPPHYDVFCLSIDFTIGFYLLLLIYRKAKSVPL